MRNAIESNRAASPCRRPSAPLRGGGGVRRPRSRRGRSGNAVLDMAFILPVLLMLTFGAVEYGYAMFVKHALQGAAREGARAAIVAGATSTSIQSAVDQAMQTAGFPQAKYVRPSTIEMCHNGSYSTNWTSAAVGDGIRVTVQAQWSAIGFNVLPTWLGGIDPSKTLTSATMMRKEG
jgi:Flp pilus assembly protein TadG